MEESEHVPAQSGLEGATDGAPASIDPFDESQRHRSLVLLVLLMYLVGVALWNAVLRFFPHPMVNLILIVAAAVLWRPKHYPALLVPFLGLGAALAITTLPQRLRPGSEALAVPRRRKKEQNRMRMREDSDHRFHRLHGLHTKFCEISVIGGLNLSVSKP